MSRVSIALATYNGGAYLAEQLASLAAQSRRPEELVVGDDGSRDQTAHVVAAFAAGSPFPVDWRANPANLGFGRNFAQTLLRCSGDYIFFCDQDDSWLPDKIAVCLAMLERSATPGIVSHDAMLADGALNPSGVTLCQQFASGGAARPDDMVYGCCLAFDRFFARFFTPDHAHAHDTWLSEIGHLLEARIHIDRALILYRRHGGNATQSHATSLRPTSRARRLLTRWRQARNEDIRREVDQQLLLADDLLAAFERNAEAVAERFGQASLDRALGSLQSRRARLASRRRVLAAPRWSRPVAVARLRRAGGYAGSSPLGILRDLIA